ncbi:hypothetical protein KAR48_19055 [bacterium]|nr:hypothetical protein [bacterium]
MIKLTKGSIFWNYIDAFSKIAIPVLLTLFVWNQNSHSVKLQKQHRSIEIDLKIVDLCWKALNSGSDYEKENAFRLAQTLKPDIAFKLLIVVALSDNQSPAFKKRAFTTVLGIGANQLRGFKIDIYFDQHNGVDSIFASTIETEFKKMNSFRDVILAGKSREAFFKDISLNNGYEVRFEKGEEEAAIILKAMLEIIFPYSVFSTRMINNSEGSPKMLSLFIFKTKGSE